MNPESNPNTLALPRSFTRDGARYWAPMLWSINGLCVAIEGLDKAGKSTLVKNLPARLAHLGREIFVSREPGGPAPRDGEPNTAAHIGRLILLEPEKLAVSGEMPHEAVLLQFLSSRFCSLHSAVMPALERGAIALCDRFYGSTSAFQLSGLEMDKIPHVAELYLLACQMIRRHPDVYIYVEAPEEVLAERRRKVNEELNHVDLMPPEFHARVRRGYERFFALDGQPPEPSLGRILERVKPSGGGEAVPRLFIADGTLSREDLADQVAAHIARFLA
jgi:dTMP kinase